MIIKLETHNFGPFKGTMEICLDAGIIHIRGVYADDAKRSNRAGKSMFLEALSYALFGGRYAQNITKGEETMGVSIHFSDGTIITRSTKGAFLNGVESSHEILNAIVHEKLGLDSKEFTITAGAFQKSLNGLLDFEPKKQKEFLLKYVGVDFNWDSLHDKLKVITRKLNDKLKEVKLRRNILENEMDTVDLPHTKTALRETIQKLIILKAEQEQIEKYEAMNKGYFVENEKKISKLEEQVRSSMKLNDIAKKNAKQLETQTAKRDTIRDLVENIPPISTLRSHIKEMDTQRVETQGQIRDLVKKLEAYNKSGGKCPILQEDCPYKTKLKKASEQWKELLQELTPLFEQLDSNLKETQSLLSTKIEKESELRTLELEVTRMIDNNLTETKDVVDLVDQLNTLYAQRDSMKDKVIEDRKIQLKGDIRWLEEHARVLASALVIRAKKHLEYRFLDTLYGKLLETQSIITVACTLVSPHGLPYFLSQALIDKLEYYTNEFLQTVNMSIYIIPFKELSSYEDTCQIDGYRFSKDEMACPVCSKLREKKIQEQMTVVAADRGTPFESESSGGQALIALALRFGLLKLLKEFGSKNDLFILDEGVANMDAQNKRQALEMLRQAEQELHLTQIFIISHDQELQQLLPTSVLITRNEETQTSTYAKV